MYVHSIISFQLLFHVNVGPMITQVKLFLKAITVSIKMTSGCGENRSNAYIWNNIQ